MEEVEQELKKENAKEEKMGKAKRKRGG